jgi:hypothetical protein
VGRAASPCSTATALSFLSLYFYGVGRSSYNRPVHAGPRSGIGRMEALPQGEARFFRERSGGAFVTSTFLSLRFISLFYSSSISRCCPAWLRDAMLRTRAPFSLRTNLARARRARLESCSADAKRANLRFPTWLRDAMLHIHVRPSCSAPILPAPNSKAALRLRSEPKLRFPTLPPRSPSFGCSTSGWLWCGWYRPVRLERAPQ